jgi:signal peptidase II
MTKKQIAILTILIVLIIDQILKIFVKTHFLLGEEFHVIGNWFILHFVENPGMAFGTELGFLGQNRKIILTLFRLIASIAIGYYLFKNIKKFPVGVIICIALIMAGAIGNIIDSVFYGYMFDKGTIFSETLNHWMGYPGMAKLNFAGYAPAFKGCVVDMLYFPIIDTTLPSWFPFGGGRSFIFFSPVFNIADSAITVGIFLILIFYRNYFNAEVKKENEEKKLVEETKEE